MYIARSFSNIFIIIHDFKIMTLGANKIGDCCKIAYDNIKLMLC